MDIIVIPKLLSNSFADEIKECLTGPQFPWHYSKRLTYDEVITQKFIANDPKIKDVDGFVNPLFVNGNKNNNYVDLFRPMMYFLEDKTGIIANEIIRIRAVWINKDATFGDYYNVPHVDIVDNENPHKTLIYYVNNSDGDTILFKEFFTGELDSTKKTIEQTIQPCKNKCVVFDGLRYHTGCVPKHNHRILININFR